MANCWIEACTRGQECCPSLREAKRKANEERSSGWSADRPDLEPPKRYTFNLEEIFGINNKKFLESLDQDTYENFVTLWDQIKIDEEPTTDDDFVKSSILEMRKPLARLFRQLDEKFRIRSVFGSEIQALGLHLMQEQYGTTWSHMTNVLASKRPPAKIALTSDTKGNKLGQNIMGKIFQYLLPENFYLQQGSKQCEVVCNYWKNSRLKSKVEHMDPAYLEKSKEKLLALLLKTHAEEHFLTIKYKKNFKYTADWWNVPLGPRVEQLSSPMNVKMHDLLKYNGVTFEEAYQRKSEVKEECMTAQMERIKQKMLDTTFQEKFETKLHDHL